MRKTLTFFRKAVKHIVLVFFAFTALVPIYYIISNAFKSEQEYVSNKFSIPLSPTIESFIIGMKDGQFLTWFMNSILMTIGSVFISTLIACFAAYAFSRLKFPGRDLIFNSMISLLAIPIVVIITPLFIFMSRLHLINSRPAAILIYSGILIPFAIYLLNNFFITIPQSLFDAAAIDGCSNFQILWRVVFPVARPAIITLTIINALYVWNELLIALVFLQSDSQKTLMAGISTFKGLYNVNIPAVMAGIFLATIPMIIIYIIGSSNFIKGILAGSVTGE